MAANTPNIPNQPNPNSAQDAINLKLSELKIEEELAQYNKKSNASIKDYLSAKKDQLKLEKEIALLRGKVDILAQKNGKQAKAELAQYKQELDFKTKLLEAQQKQLNGTSKLLLLGKEIAALTLVGDLFEVGKLLEYINSADKAFKSLNKTMGLGGISTDILRDNLVSSAMDAAKLGVSFEDLTKIQGSYTDQLGTATLLSKENLLYISQVAKGTQMGVEQAGKMAAKFNQIGVSVKGVRDFYQDAVNQSFQFGVSADAVLKKINDNFDRAQQYVFKDGVNGLKEMAMYSTKFSLDMNSVFSGLDKNNNLEGVVDTVSKLQVLGGKFASVDPFKLLFQARNDAAGFEKTIQGITAGMATWNKQNGDFEITAGDLNRLKLAADATGLSYESLISTAKKGAQINLIDSMLGGRIDKKAQEFIEGVAQIQKDGSFKVQISPGNLKDIKDLSQGQVNALMASNASLEKRAQDAQAFDEVLKNTVNELKAAFLPVLKTVDGVITFLRDNHLLEAVVGVGSIVALSVGVIGPLVGSIKSLASFFKGGGGVLKGLIGGGGGGKITNALGGAGAATEETGQLAGNIKNVGAEAGGAWKNILAFGGAIALIGAGIFVATEGISAMATAFKGLNGEQLIGINTGLVILLGGMTGIAAVGMLAGAAAPEILLFGGAVLAIGAGIGIAAAGLGYMAKGFGDLFDSLAKVSNPQLIENLSALVISVSALGGASLLFANPLAWIGLKVLTNSVGDLADKIREANFQSLEIGAASFSNIAAAIESIDDKKLDKLVALSESLSSINSIASVVGAFTNLFGDGIKVKFDDTKVNLEIDITNQIDTQQLSKRFIKSVPIGVDNAKKGKAL